MVTANDFDVFDRKSEIETFIFGFGVVISMMKKIVFSVVLFLLVLQFVSADVPTPPKLLPAPSFAEEYWGAKFTINNASDYGDYTFYSSYYGGSVPFPNAPPSSGSIYILAVPKGTPRSEVIGVAVQGVIPAEAGHTFWRITAFNAENKTMELALVNSEPGPEPGPQPALQLPMEILLLIVVVAAAVVLFALKYSRKIKARK